MMLHVGKRVFVASVITVVIVTIIACFTFIESPSQGRARRVDERRSQDLMTMSEMVNDFWSDQNRLPMDLDELEKLRNNSGLSINRKYDPTIFQLPMDPITGLPYDYRPMTTSTYELCATFAMQRFSDSDIRQKGISGYQESFFEHEKGTQCFTSEIVHMERPLPG